MIRIELRPEARAEMHQAFAWYEEKQPGLGYQFLYAVDAVLERVRRQPRSHPSIGGEVRRALVRRFPYAVVFEAEEDRVTVFAMYHGHRRPRDWSDRVFEAIPGYAKASSKERPLTTFGHRSIDDLSRIADARSWSLV